MTTFAYDGRGNADCVMTSNDLALANDFISPGTHSTLAGTPCNGTAPATNPFLLGNASGTDLRRSNDDFTLHQLRVTAAFRF